MKGLELTSDAKHILVVEKDDRLVILGENDVSIVIGESTETKDNDGVTDLKVSVHFPANVDPDAPTPRPMVLAACVRVFLDNPEWVNQAEAILAQQTNTGVEEEQVPPQDLS